MDADLASWEAKRQLCLLGLLGLALKARRCKRQWYDRMQTFYAIHLLRQLQHLIRRRDIHA